MTVGNDRTEARRRGIVPAPNIGDAQEGQAPGTRQAGESREVTDEKRSPWSGPRAEPAEPPQLPEATCPWCGAANDAATHIGDGNPRPDPGDIAICAYCGGLAQYTADGGQAKLSPDDELLARNHPQVKRLLAALRLYHRSRAAEGEEP